MIRNCPQNGAKSLGPTIQVTLSFAPLGPVTDLVSPSPTNLGNGCSAVRGAPSQVSG